MSGCRRFAIAAATNVNGEPLPPINLTPSCVSSVGLWCRCGFCELPFNDLPLINFCPINWKNTNSSQWNPLFLSFWISNWILLNLDSGTTQFRIVRNASKNSFWQLSPICIRIHIVVYCLKSKQTTEISRFPSNSMRFQNVLCIPWLFECGAPIF